jgi:myo-inositol-1(or 4)-monophosphatase
MASQPEWPESPESPESAKSRASPGSREAPEHRELLAIARRAAESAVAVIRAAAPRVRSIDWRNKAPADFVSEVDVEAEARILEVVVKELPEARVLAEESAVEIDAEQLRSGLAVVVDPLDGTTNFLHGYPEYAVSIAILEDGAPVAAAVVNVPRQEWFTATKGGGTVVRTGTGVGFGAGAGVGSGSVRCAVSAITDPRRALIGTGFPFKSAHDIPPYQAQMSRVMAAASGVRRPGAASLDLASVASGRFDAFWENMLSPWDFAAGMLLVTEAGGVVSTVEGGKLDPVVSSSVLAGSPVMHDWLGRMVRGEA